MVEEEIAAFLVGQGLAEGVKVDIFFEDDPNTPDTCLILQSFVGPPPLYQPAVQFYTQERPGLQVTVRDATDKRAAKYRAENLLRALGSISNLDINGVRYLSVRAAGSGAISLPDDKRNRKAYTVNFDVMKSPSPLS